MEAWTVERDLSKRGNTMPRRFLTAGIELWRGAARMRGTVSCQPCCVLLKINIASFRLINNSVVSILACIDSTGCYTSSGFIEISD
ncbi:MAG: hypothetical protein JWL90_3236 [Chthoniobacteraceae bacterium]|nr:hypothetical protein [Chthoniobacteraceae bacterium]